MSAAAARAEIVAVAAGMGLPFTRAGRFHARLRGEVPLSFAALCAAPRWPVLGEEARLQVGAVAILLSGARMLAREIEGSRLRAYASLVGDEVLDRIVLHGDGRDTLPAPDRLPTMARDLIAQVVQSREAGEQLLAAELFLKEANAWPST